MLTAEHCLRRAERFRLKMLTASEPGGSRLRDIADNYRRLAYGARPQSGPRLQVVPARAVESAKMAIKLVNFGTFKSFRTCGTHLFLPFSRRDPHSPTPPLQQGYVLGRELYFLVESYTSRRPGKHRIKEDLATTNQGIVV